MVAMSNDRNDRSDARGLFAAGLIITAWAAHLAYSLAATGTTGSVARAVLHVAIQSYLYTGLFITAHDAIHGSVTSNRKLNTAIGRTASTLFAAFSYSRLQRNHMKHHRWPGTERDPDFSVRYRNPLFWFAEFFLRYVTILQIVIMAILFNLLSLLVPTERVILFWMVPAFLGTFQLFYFGTYRPHLLPHTAEMEPYRARSQRHNHVWAMASCYFFGYHHEHHASPGTPWWRLHRRKDENEELRRSGA
jgi:beta-carotene/zeaxanthin 4-ketolase